MFKLEMTGLKELERKLSDVKNRATELDGEHQVPFTELFNDSFMDKYTNFSSLEEMFQASGYNIESPEDFKAIPNEPWDEFIKNNSQFESWEEMRNTAAKEWMAKQLGL